MGILKTLTVNGVTYNIAPIVPAASITLLAAAWEGAGEVYSQMVEVPGVTAHTKVDLQPTAEQLAEFHYKILAFSAENDGGTVTVYSIGDKPDGDHTIQITKTEVEGTGKIRGNTVGTTMPRPDWNQTDPKKADYIKNKPDLDGRLKEMLPRDEAPTVVNEALAQAKASGEFDGKDGYTPVKGVDYFDGQPGKDGTNGKDGKDGTNGKDGKDGYTPVKGVDYYTEVDEAEFEAWLAGELAKRGQVKPEFADSISDCTDTTKLYVLPDGYIYAYMRWKAYKNQIAYATDTDGSIYNGVGYGNGRLSSSGGVSSGPNMSVTGFIPCKMYDIVRLLGINYNKNSNALSSHRVLFYDASKAFLTGTVVQGMNIDNLEAVWNNEGDLVQFTVNEYYGGKGDDYAYFRICGDTFDENPIITVNEDPDHSYVSEWRSTGYAFVPADYEERIVALEEQSETNHASIINCGEKLFEHDERLFVLEHSGNSDIPDYVQTAAKAVARTVNSRQNETSAVFAFLADGHCGWGTDATHEAVRQAAQATEVINNRCPLDFVAHGGDMSLGGSYSTIDSTFSEIEDYTEIMSAVSAAIPSLWFPGNHDDAPYQATADRLTQAQVFSLIGRKNLRSGAVFNPGCNYGYLDLNSRRVRVIYLDTHDKRSWGTVWVTEGSPDFLSADNISDEQLRWLIDTALDFSEKDNPGEWAVVILSHAALNIAGTIADAVSGANYAYSTANAATILAAYRDGESGSITHNGVTVNYNFSALTKRAEICCAVHGHNHMYYTETINGIVSIGCPNVMNGRERQSADGNTYVKTAGTAEGTSFCVITVDRQNRKIYADHYGAGYNRVIDY